MAEEREDGDVTRDLPGAARAAGEEAPAARRRLTRRDAAVVERQLGRPPRGACRVAHRCPCGLPDVVETAPRLPGGEPFPTLFYLTCPRAASAIGTLEGSGMMRAMQARLAEDADLAARYRAAHEDYIARRDKAAAEAGLSPLPRGMQSAGGMPSRVKCLHALVAHELAVPGINPFGREALDALPEWWAAGPCVDVTTLEGLDDLPGEESAGTAADGADAGKRHGNGEAAR